ncbi:L-threonylcarbamoyladenylate synthase [Rarobacter faecitabidus]|uniref:L-threonylcarbamoyladenylate synthase n=1 Tax=Rarobacter faecitabidus TaxID=13243 RepID=UPI00114EF83A|nr:L-threonylcarbamoyladenylate synthase [Rarobacter faecitabidus]
MRDVSDESAWGPALDEAVNAIGRGGLIVLPTDTVYGIGADAFDGRAVAGLLAAKGRGRQMPPPVLIASAQVLDALAESVPDEARTLVAKFWPGPLTIICHSQPSLAWDLGETHGTVALRMPDHPAALALLRRTGPLAVSSANKTGGPAATSAREAADQLGDSVAVYLDAGNSPLGQASTIVDATGPVLRIVREGGVSYADLAQLVPGILPVEGTPPARAADDDGDAGE